MIANAELAGIEHLWDAGLHPLYDDYLEACDGFGVDKREPLALAGALVELALGEQRLGREAARPAALLVADLCLARASRLLAESAPVSVQVGFARAVEDAATAAVAGVAEPVRPRLVEVLRGGG